MACHHQHPRSHQLPFLQLSEHFVNSKTVIPAKREPSLTCCVEPGQILVLMLPFPLLQKRQKSIFICERLSYGLSRWIKNILVAYSLWVLVGDTET